MVDPFTLPKVELHLHLDCSLSVEGLRRLGQPVTREEYLHEYTAPDPCPNVAAFLSRVAKVLPLLQSSEALHILVGDVFDQLSQDRVLYAELRFAPLLHTAAGMSPEQVVDTVDGAVEQMVRTTGIEARLILCALRNYTERETLAVAELARAFRHRRVVGLDLAGDEAAFPLRPHAAAYRYAHEHGLGTTAHAGESLGPDGVRETLRELAPERIGHGVRCVEDPALVNHLGRTGIHLELCPSGEVRFVGAIPRWQTHPVDRLRAAGVSLSVNTGARQLPTTLRHEYALIREHFGWTPGTFLASNVAALRHAFLDEATKTTLLSHLVSAWNAGVELDLPV